MTEGRCVFETNIGGVGYSAPHWVIGAMGAQVLCKDKARSSSLLSSTITTGSSKVKVQQDYVVVTVMRRSEGALYRVQARMRVLHLTPLIWG